MNQPNKNKKKNLKQEPNVIKKDNIPSVNKLRNIEDEIIYKDSETNGYKNNKNEYVYKNEKGIYEKYIPKKQPTITQRKDSEVTKYYENKAKDEQLEKDIIKKLDVTTDLMQAGKFVPHPIFQTIGNVGSALGAGVDLYQGYNDLKNENYGDAAINFSSSLLPLYLNNKTFLRNTKYSSFAPELNEVFGDYGRTKYLNLLNRVRKQSPEQLFFNRAAFTTLGAETINDAQNEQNKFYNGGNLKQQNKNINMPDPIKKPNRLAYENELMSKILTQKNKNKNFVQRALNPGEYPSIINEDGSETTHLMQYSTDDNGNAYVSPTVIQNQLGLLSKLNEDEAVQYGAKSGEEIMIPNIDLADYYTKNGLIKHAYGGNLQQQNNNNMLTEFNEGGRHEENPYGGIPQGSSSNGQMNTVEQGETKKGNFVYSDRLYINEDLAKQMNLPSYIKGKTFANASKSINDKFKGRNDIHTKATQKELLDRLANAQEYLKQQEAQINESMQSNMQTPEFGNQFKGGGLMGLGFSTQDDSLNSGDTPATMGNSNGGGFMNFMKNNSSNVNQLGDMFSGASTYSGQMKAAANAGYQDNKAIQDEKNSKMMDKTKDTVASVFGPIGQFWRGIQKLGKGIGDTIGGDGGAVVSGVFSPEEGTMSAWTDKDANIGEKLLATVPGVGNVLANKRADKRLSAYKDNRLRLENFFKYKFNENNNSTKVFAGGGLLDNTNPIVKNKQLSGNNSIGSDIINNKLPNQGGSLGAKLMGEINDISKVGSGYRILYDTPEGVKHEIVNNNAFKGMGNLPELKRYYYKKRTINDPSLIDSPEKIELLKKGWQSSGYNPSQVSYPQAIEDYRKATGQKGFYTPEQLSTYRPMAKGGPLPFSTEQDDPNYIPNYDNPMWLAGENAYDFVNDVNNRNKISQEEIDYLSSNPDFASPEINFNKPEPFETVSDEKMSKQKQKNKNTFNKIMNGLSNAQRYAPILGNMLQKASIGPAEVDKAIKNRYQYQRQLMDTKALENIASQEAHNTNQVLAQSGLTGNQLLSAMMGSQLNRTKAISDAYQQVNQHNINENKLAEQVRQQNESDYINDSRYVRETNAQNRANRDTQISKFNSEIYNALGDIGKENIFKKQAEKLTGYSWMGDYLMSNPEYKSQFDAIEKDPSLDDETKYAKQQLLIQQIYKGMTSEDIKLANEHINSILTMGHKKENKKYGGYLTPKFKKY